MEEDQGMSHLSGKITRRELMQKMALGGAGIVAASAMAACSTPTPQVIKETVTVEKVVTSTPAAAKPVDITFWAPAMWKYGKDNVTVDRPVDEWILDAVERFKAAGHPNINVNVEIMPWDQWGPKLTTAFSTGDMANVMYGNGSFTADRCLAGMFEAVDDYVTAEDLANWLPGPRESTIMYGRRWSMPGFLNPSLAVLNATGLETYGGADLIKDIGENRGGLTFDLMKQRGMEFSNGTDRWFYGIGTDHGGVTYFNFGCWLKGWGLRCWDEAEERWVVADQPGAVEAFQWYVDAQNEWKILVPNLPKYADVGNMLWQSKIAMRNHWASSVGNLVNAQKAGQAPADYKMLLVCYPHLANIEPFAAGGRGSPNLGFVVGRTNDAAKRDASAAFAKWLSTDDSNQIMWVSIGTFPITLTGAKIVAKDARMQDPNMQWVLNTLLGTMKPEGVGEGENWSPIINARSSKLFNELKPADYFIQMFQSLLSGQRTAQQMLTEMSARINGAISGKA
jgi:ABC-type glycerol-3-phosphate transport system substrate-binding protein